MGEWASTSSVAIRQRGSGEPTVTQEVVLPSSSQRPRSPGGGCFSTGGVMRHNDRLPSGTSSQHSRTPPLSQTPPLSRPSSPDGARSSKSASVSVRSQRRDGGGPVQRGGASGGWGRRQGGAEGGASGRREAAPPRQTVGLGLLGREALEQLRQLLLPLPQQVVQVALADQQRGLGADQAAVVPQLLLAQVGPQDGVDRPLPPVQVILQLAGVVRLAQQQGALVQEGVLGGGR